MNHLIMLVLYKPLNKGWLFLHAKDKFTLLSEVLPYPINWNQVHY